MMTEENITEMCELLPGGEYTVRGCVVSLGEIRKQEEKFFSGSLFPMETQSLGLLWFNYNPRYLRGLFREGMAFS